MTSTTRWRLATLGLLGLGLCAAAPSVQSAIPSRLRWSDGSLITLGAPPAEGEALVLSSGILTGGTSGTTITGTPTEGDAAIYTSGAWTATGSADARAALGAVLGGP